MTGARESAVRKTGARGIPPGTDVPYQRWYARAWCVCVCALLAGGLHAWALSPTLSLSVAFGEAQACAQLVALALLAWLITCAHGAWRAALTGWLFAFAWFSGSLWWIHVSMTVYGGVPFILAAAAVLLLCAFMALIFALTLSLARKASSAGTVFPLAFTAAWLLAEIVRGKLFTGFPWASSGYAHVDGWLAAYAPWLGVYGIGAVVALIASSGVACIQGARHRCWCNAMPWGLVVLVLFGLSWPLGHGFTESAGSLRVVLLQGNVPQNLKFEPEVVGAAQSWYFDAMRQAQQQSVDLVVTPESAVFNVNMQEWRQLRHEFSSGKTAALIGMLVWNTDGGVTNSMVGLVPGETQAYRYDKYHLVPFGEFIPWGFRWFVEKLNIPLGDLESGLINAPSMLLAGQRIAPSICYEDLFGEELARRFADPATAPTLLANASNIAWFGDTLALPQHLQIARMRALEFERPMVRATNTGVTAIIDHRGEVQQMLTVLTPGVLEGTVDARTGLTPYARWAGAWGLAPLWGIAILVMIVCLLWPARAAGSQRAEPVK